MKVTGKRYSLFVADKFVEISQHNSNVLVYRVDYDFLKDFDNEYLNQFIVYILVGYNSIGDDYIYVGKSKNGVLNRPLSHEDKCNHWMHCFLLTQTKGKSFFNDGIIQYLEDKLNKRVSSLEKFINTTKQTTSGTVNHYDKVDCDEYLDEIYPMLYALGLDLTTEHSSYLDKEEDDDEEVTLEELEKAARSLPMNDRADSLETLKEYMFGEETDWDTFIRKKRATGIDKKINEGKVIFTREDLYNVPLIFKSNKKGVCADGFLTQKGFVVKRGSKASPYSYDSKDKGVQKYGELRKQLETTRYIVGDVFKRQYTFNTPLEAAVVLFGSWCTQNMWVTQDGKGLGDILSTHKKR